MAAVYTEDVIRLLFMSCNVVHLVMCSCYEQLVDYKRLFWPMMTH